MRRLAVDITTAAVMIIKADAAANRNPHRFSMDTRDRKAPETPSSIGPGGGGEHSHPVRLCGSALGARAHVCAFFSNADEQHRALLAFSEEGLACGDKVVHTIDPARRDEYTNRWISDGVDVSAAQASGRFELLTWRQTHLVDGAFEPSRTLAFFERLVRDAKHQGFPLVRFVTQMEWALEDESVLLDLLEYEAKASEIWLRQQGPVNPVVCTYDLTKFSGEFIVDVMRTHPMTIIGGTLHENPYFVPPEEFLRELRARPRIRGNLRRA